MAENQRKAFKKVCKVIILLICVIVFLAILEDVFNAETLKIDKVIYKLIVENMRNNVFTNIFRIITNFGSAYMLILISILSLIFIKDKKISISICANLAISTGLNILVKNIVQRPRPMGYRIIDETGYSFPSGHSMVSMAFYGLIIYFIWKNVKNKYIRNTACTLLGILIILIGTSRIYLGVHYASDVLGGFVISLAYLIVFTVGYKNIFKAYKNKNEIK